MDDILIPGCTEDINEIKSCLLELRELLSAELSEELTDDDQSSVNDSHRSLPQDVSNEHQEIVDSPVITSNAGWMQGVNGGTYVANKVAQQSITSAPVDQLHSDQYYGRHVNGYDYDTANQYNFSSGQHHYYDPSYGVVTSQTQPWQQTDYGNNVIFSQQRSNGIGQFMQYNNQNGVTLQPVEDVGEYPFAERGEVEGSEDYGDAVDGNVMQHHQQFVQYKPTSKSTLTPSSGSKLSYRQSYPPNHGRSKHHGSYSRYDSPHDVSVESSPADYENRERDKLQQQFTNIANENREENSRQMAQLQILYKARGKKIDELTRELDEIKSENAREKRILNHQLAMAKDQKDGMGTSLEESQRLVQEKERDIEELKGKVDAQTAENDSLKLNKNELLAKIQVSERTIESLHEQLTQMSHSESIERARDKHDAVLNAATQRHEMQVLELTTQLDECRQEMSEKTDEIEKLRFHLNKVSRESEQTLLDKTETINRLTRSLEESQNQCQGLLAGSNETAFSRHQVTDLMQERKQNEEEIALLKMQARDADEHLKLYEKALQLGAGSGNHHRLRGGDLSDSLSELMNNDVARKLDWKTPQIKTPVFESGSQEELLDGLRKELQRALNCNKSKRDEVTKLKQQCIELVKESSHWRSRADEAQTQLKLNISMPAEKPQEKEEKALKSQDLEERLRNSEDEVKRLDKTCTEVKQRMAEMIQEHDQDKQDAVERCERALMQLHEDAKQALRDELVSEQEQKLYELSVDHDARMRELNSELDELQHELYDVKQSYVHVCAEKDQIQRTTGDELSLQYEKEKEELISEHETAIKKLENMLEHLETDMKEKIEEEKEKCGLEWENEREKIIASMKNEWELERESDFTQRMDTQIALAKVDWFEEFSNSKQKAINAAVKQEEEKWTEKIEELRTLWNEQATAERENHLKEERQKWMEEKNEEISRLQEEFQSEKESAVKMATCMAELNKTLHKENSEEETKQLLEVKLNEARNDWEKKQEDLLQDARESWRKEHDDAMEEAEVSWKQENESLREAVTDVRQEMEKELERERKTHKSVMEKAVKEVKKISDQEKQNVLRQKTADMEKEINKLQDQHRKDYELFVEEHKRTLATFLENEKTRATATPVCRDAFTQAEKMFNERRNSAEDRQKLWNFEKEELSKKNRKEVADLQKNYEQRFTEQRNEIQHLVNEKNDITTKLQQTESELQIQGERVALDIEKEKSQLKIENERLKNEISSIESRTTRINEQNKDDMNRLKERMREEYRRWKKERANLIAKLKEHAVITSPSYRSETATSSTERSSSCRFCRTTQENHSELLKHKDEATRKAISELTDIYAGTLKMIKDEMMSYISESRGRTKETISQERKRTASKLRSHYAKAMHKFRMKSENENQAELVQRLKLFESDNDSRPETPEVADIRMTKQPTSKILSVKDFQSHSKPSSTETDARPKSLQNERFLDRYEDGNHFPTKLLPERDHFQESSTFLQLPKVSDQISANRSGQSFVPSNGAFTRLPQYTRHQGESANPAYTTEKRNIDFRYGDPPMRSYQHQLPRSVDFSPRHAPRGAGSQNLSDFRTLQDAQDNASLGATYRPPRSANR